MLAPIPPSHTQNYQGGDLIWNGEPLMHLYVVRSCHMLTTTHDQTELSLRKYMPLPMCTLRFSPAILGVRAKLLEGLNPQLN